MSDTGLTVRDMTGPLHRYDVTVAIDRDSRQPPNPAEFAETAERQHRPGLPAS